MQKMINYDYVSKEHTLHEKAYFLFPNVLKRLSFQKNCTGILSGKMVFFSRKYDLIV